MSERREQASEQPPDAPTPPEKTDYKVDDQELLLGFYKWILWDWLVPKIPARISPNSLTIAGQIFAVLAALACGVATQQSIPILYAASALAFMIYLTADNVDGPHARRTGQSSPLGEFLDHGLDGSASTAALIATCFMLRLDGVVMAALCAVGALGFVVVFWEQFRTGVLIIPKVSTTEGVTLLSVCLVLVAILHEPAWMHFNWNAITFGTALVVILLIGYAAACVPPVVRVKRAGKPAFELLSVALILGAHVGIVALGANAIIPAVASGLVGGDVTCRIILLRHRGETDRPILSPVLWLTFVPLGMAALGVWRPDGWAAVALAIVVGSYGTELVRGGRELIVRHRSRTS